MSYNNQPEWETYKPTIKEEEKEEEYEGEYEGEYECGCPSSIEESYIMWGRNEDGEEEEVYICYDCEDKWIEDGWVNSMDYEDYEEYENEVNMEAQQ